jgi:hypothetical protein
VESAFGFLRGWAGRPGGLTVLIGFVAIRVSLLLFHSHVATDLQIYHRWLSMAAEGQRPFVDFPIEYPPLAWWVMHVPATLDWESYVFRFRLMLGAVDVAAFLLLAWLVSRRRPSLLTPVAGLYVLSTTILENVLFDRLDLGVLLCVLIALGAWVAPAPSHSGRWRVVAYAMLGAGTAFKVFPVVIAPFLFLADLRGGSRPAVVFARAMAFPVAALLPIAVAYADAGPGVLGFLLYHSERGLEFESTWASLLWLVSWWGTPVEIVSRFGSWELAGPADALLAQIATFTTGGFVAGLIGWGALLGERYTRERAYLQALLAMTGFLVFAKVLSPQFLIWGIPLLALAALEAFESEWQTRAYLGMLAVIAALTAVVWPLGMYQIPLTPPWVLAAAAVRNVCLTAAFVWLVLACLNQDRRTAAAREGRRISGASAGIPPAL